MELLDLRDHQARLEPRAHRGQVATRENKALQVNRVRGERLESQVSQD